MVRLSILIATMPSRSEKMKQLASELVRQVNPPINHSGLVEILIDPSMDYNIGVKRNKLLERATGDYIVFIDDDDIVSPNYVSLILGAIETNPDCVAIAGIVSLNGGIPKQWYISRIFGGWYEKNDIYYRTPNHISPVRRDLALQAMFPEISFGEDHEYSKRLLPLLQTETEITENIYNYIYVDK